MDAILPIVFALAFFLLQGYFNYKKEQEKAKKRNPGNPPQPVVPSNKPVQSETSWFEEILQPTPGQQVPHQTIEPIPTAPAVVESRGTGQEKYIPEKYQQVVYKPIRSEEHTSELQSLMRISYAVFCLTKKIKKKRYKRQEHTETSMIEETTHQ